MKNIDKGFYELQKKLEDKKNSLQFLPKKLEDLAKNKKFEYKGHTLKTTYIVDIVHNLILKYYFKKDNKFNLMSTILKEKYGHLYNFYIDYLVDNNILEMIANYRAGRNSRVYKIKSGLNI